MKVVKEFSRFAHEYNKYNVIQKEVAKKLCGFLEKRDYETILDLGAGDGEVYRNLLRENIEVDKFTALDFSDQMLALHPTGENIEKVCLDFNSHTFSKYFSLNQFDLIISSSALQWSDNLFFVLKSLSKLSNQFYFSFFTSNTFRTLHKTANVNSPIYSKEKILEALDNLFEYEMEIVEYKLDFESVHDMLRYIKKSGVSAGVEQLSFKQMKLLMENYPLGYLEFEVVFFKGKLK